MQSFHLCALKFQVNRKHHERQQQANFLAADIKIDDEKLTESDPIQH